VPPRPLRYLLVTDGSSDACLMHPIDWLLRACDWNECVGEWADLRGLPDSSSLLADQLRLALALYPSELVFVHRDAERQDPELRVAQITAAIAELSTQVRHVCVVPVRMMEAWLLHDEVAIRRAAGKPNGKQKLLLPSLSRVETVADPKSALREALLLASETSGRRHKQKLRDFGIMRRRVAELIDDYSPLRAVSAFARLEQELRTTLDQLDR
jgi:hypothetical protein